MIVLKPKREKSILNRHPWIFSGGVQSVKGSFNPGDVVPVFSASGALLGKGIYNPKSQIMVRMVTWSDVSVDSAFWNARLDQCLEKRAQLASKTNAFRVVHGESDGVPGLVLDKISDAVVVQLSSVGMIPLRPVIQEWILSRLNPRLIIERSEGSSLKFEGLSLTNSVWWGQSPVDGFEIVESGRKYRVDVERGQKTGFFLDQRDNRCRVAELAPKSTLNLFSYTGGFTIPAAATGSTVSVDSSRPALEMIESNLQLNGIDSPDHHIIEDDVFTYLRNESAVYDLVVCDPPALVKRRDDVEKAARAYKDVNRLSIGAVKPGGHLLTCSCSQFLGWELFRQILFSAGVEAGRDVQIVGQFTQPEDHCVNLYFPEGEYLKTFLLKII
ncbi:class I SAM-dependent rRNA methyltransferase [bacterium]|nr:class I SAM-dependent rRNA methyltransferase [bacterium]